jgi:hypothetical protein
VLESNGSTTGNNRQSRCDMGTRYVEIDIGDL